MTLIFMVGRYVPAVESIFYCRNAYGLAWIVAMPLERCLTVGQWSIVACSTDSIDRIIEP